MSSVSSVEPNTTTRRNFMRDGKFYATIQNAVKSFGRKKKSSSEYAFVSSSPSSTSPSSSSKTESSNSTLYQAIKKLITSFLSPEYNAVDSLLIKTQSIGFSQFLFILFLIISLGKYAEDEIVCVRQYDRTLMDEEEEELCLQYSYTEEVQKNGTTKRHYVLFYRWFHLGLCFFSAYFYTLQLAIKFHTFQPLNEMIRKKKTSSGLNLDDVKLYWQKYLGAHENLYTKKIYMHVLALIMNIAGYFSIDLLIQGRYKTLPSFLFVTRDIEFFDDDMSFIFPPFVKCEITPVHQLWLERRELFGCHLSNMIIYEKFIFMIWFSQVFLAVWCCCYILILIIPCAVRFFKKSLQVQGFYQYTKLTNTLSDKLNTGDSYAFGVTTDYLRTSDFVEIQHTLLNKLDSLDL